MKRLTLTLTSAQCQQMIDHALAGSPDEVCGLIGGWGSTANLILPLPNVASTPRNRYLIDPKAFVAAYAQIERSGGELIGIYHSHPAGEPIPSPTDIAEVTWPDVVYLIVGLADCTPRMAAWSLQNGMALPVQLITSPPNPIHPL